MEGGWEGRLHDGEVHASAVLWSAPLTAPLTMVLRLASCGWGGGEEMREG